jgi:hypothetical protein
MIRTSIQVWNRIKCSANEGLHPLLKTHHNSWLADVGISFWSFQNIWIYERSMWWTAKKSVHHTFTDKHKRNHQSCEWKLHDCPLTPSITPQIYRCVKFCFSKTKLAIWWHQLKTITGFISITEMQEFQICFQKWLNCQSSCIKLQQNFVFLRRQQWISE